MNDIDPKIREALKRSEMGDALADEPNMAEELIGTFRTRHRGLHLAAFLMTLLFFGLAVWAAQRSAAADVVREQLLWGGICLLAMVSVGFLKIYFWLEMHTNRLLREMKRLELLVLQSRARDTAP